MSECSGCHQNIEDCTCAEDYERIERKHKFKTQLTKKEGKNET